jgi:hypothetical protein
MGHHRNPADAVKDRLGAADELSQPGKVSAADYAVEDVLKTCAC